MLNLKKLLSGDEAIARGAWEAGVATGFGYPGTPSTEILENFALYPEVYAEWSINEKVALEAATGASLGGARALCTMKHVGLNVALDAFVTLAYTGINSGLVVVSADDPGMHSSQNEQDNRYLGRFSYTPVIEPSDSQEAKDFIKPAFEISEQFDIPVLFRITTRIAHSKSVVEIDEKIKFKAIKKEMSVPWDKYVMMPLNAKKRRVSLIERFERLKKMAEASPLNTVEEGEGDTAFITSGISYHYVKEVFTGKPVFKLGLLNPLPIERLRKFASKYKKIYVVEEVEPYIEEYLKNNGIECEGKSTVPLIDELSPDRLKQSFENAQAGKTAFEVPARPPSLCADCGHRGVFKVLSKLKFNVMGDIGCYTLGALPPFSAMQTCIDMGAGISHAYGIETAGNDPSKTVAVIGDSTFMHSGITGIANLVYNNGNTFVIILDNGTTAMTGRQPHPATQKTLKGADAKPVNLEKLLSALGVEHIAVLDPFDMKKLEETIVDFAAKKGVKVLIARRDCALLK
jgi:indolepyruvate ferredoxin oxidoreductase, alpha subunit